MFLKWAKNKVKNWFNKEGNKEALAKWAAPLLLSALRALAKKTANPYDDAAVQALDAWMLHRGK